jgi:hypothetical protein
MVPRTGSGILYFKFRVPSRTGSSGTLQDVEFLIVPEPVSRTRFNPCINWVSSKENI